MQVGTDVPSMEMRQYKRSMALVTLRVSVSVSFSLVTFTNSDANAGMYLKARFLLWDQSADSNGNANVGVNGP